MSKRKGPYEPTGLPKSIRKGPKNGYEYSGKPYEPPKPKDPT